MHTHTHSAPWGSEEGEHSRSIRRPGGSLQKLIDMKKKKGEEKNNNIKKNKVCFLSIFCASGELRSGAWLIILHKGNQCSFQCSSSEPYVLEAIWNRLVAFACSFARSLPLKRLRGGIFFFFFAAVFVSQRGAEQSHRLEQIAWATGATVWSTTKSRHISLPSLWRRLTGAYVLRARQCVCLRVCMLKGR